MAKNHFKTLQYELVKLAGVVLKTYGDYDAQIDSRHELAEEVTKIGLLIIKHSVSMSHEEIQTLDVLRENLEQYQAHVARVGLRRKFGD